MAYLRFSVSWIHDQIRGGLIPPRVGSEKGVDFGENKTTPVLRPMRSLEWKEPLWLSLIVLRNKVDS